MEHLIPQGLFFRQSDPFEQNEARPVPHNIKLPQNTVKVSAM